MTTSLSRPHDTLPLETDSFGKGVYGGAEALRLVNYRREAEHRSIARQTVRRWLRGYHYERAGQTQYVEPLWRSDYDSGDAQDLEISFRDLIELRFVKALRALGLSLQTIRACFERAVEEVRDPRPFSTRKFRTDGRTIFLEITDGFEDATLLDLKKRQGVFRSVVAPSFKDLEFDADVVVRWFPLGKERSVVVDPQRSFGRPIVGYGVPTEVIREAIAIEGSDQAVAKLYDLPIAVVRDAATFEKQLAA